MTTIVIIGDVGGCADELARAVPPADAGSDTLVIQVGDLIDRGADSPGVLALVQRRLERRCPARRLEGPIGVRPTIRKWPQRLGIIHP